MFDATPLLLMWLLQPDVFYVSKVLLIVEWCCDPIDWLSILLHNPSANQSVLSLSFCPETLISNGSDSRRSFPRSLVHLVNSWRRGLRPQKWTIRKKAVPDPKQCQPWMTLFPLPASLCLKSSSTACRNRKEKEEGKEDRWVLGVNRCSCEL